MSASYAKADASGQQTDITDLRSAFGGIQYPEGASLHRRERDAGSFDRTLAVPVEVDVDRVQAEYNNGVLALLLPRAERDKPKTITIG